MLTNFQKVLLSRQLTWRKISALNDKINHFLYNKEISYNWRVSVIVSTYIKKFRPPLTLYRLIFRISWKGDVTPEDLHWYLNPQVEVQTNGRVPVGALFPIFILFYFIFFTKFDIFTWGIPKCAVVTLIKKPNHIDETLLKNECTCATS